MKKIWKYVLSILLVIILATAGTIYYFLNVKTYNTADEEVEEIIESEYDIVLPGVPDANAADDTQNEDKSPSNNNENGTSNNEDGTSNESYTATEIETSKDSEEVTTDSNKNNSGTTKPGKSSPSGTKTPDKNTTNTPVESTEVTVADIKNLYRPVFKSLESQATGKIDALTSRAVGEYRSKKAAGEDISYSYFYQKYTSAGRNLEAKTDEAFNYIYKALEKELKKHGYSSTHAKDFQEQYASAKKAREAALINKAKEAF
jgi:ABC-type cobalt transport system substrate-binding protein